MINEKQKERIAYKVGGFTVSTAEQVRVILLMAMIKRDEPLAKTAQWVLNQIEKFDNENV